MNDYLFFMLVFATSAASPGPEIAALLSRSLAGGMRASLPLALGILFGKLVMLSAAVAGLSALLATLGPMFIVLKLCGAAYLLWLGIKKWRNAGRVLDADTREGSGKPAVEIALGMAMTLSNPMAIVFFIALLPGAINLVEIAFATYFYLCGIVAGVMCVIVFGYGLAAEVARKLFSSRNATVHIDRTAAAMMIGAAGLIVVR